MCPRQPLLFLIAVVLAVMSQTARPQSTTNCPLNSGAEAAGNATSTFYALNGILTSKEDAKANSQLLESLVREGLTDSENSVSEFRYIYNDTQGINDLFEVLLLNAGLDRSRYFRALAGIEPLPDFVQNFFDQLATHSVFDANALDPDTLARVKDCSRETLHQGKRVVLVAHSQGNLYSNSVASLLSPSEKQSWATVNVAVPDRVAEGSKTEYVTLLLDGVIYPIAALARSRQLLLPPLLPNTNDGYVNPYARTLNHNFIAAYLSTEPSRGRIVARAVETMRSLTVPPGPNPPPIASFVARVGSVETTTAEVGQTVDFDGSASSGTIRSYKWEVRDVLGTTLTFSTSQRASRVFLLPGPYEITLTVTDNLLASSEAKKTITVRASNPAPIAAFTARVGTAETFTVAAGQQIVFDPAGSSDPGGAITNYEWDFGNGSLNTPSAAPVPYVYTTPGSYTVRLTVTDNGTPPRTGEVSHLVTVTAAPSPSSILVDSSTPGRYNDSIGFALNTNGTHDPFPCNDVACGDTSERFPTAPNLDAAAGVLGSWLTSPASPGGAWSGVQPIPATWAVNTESAIIYTFDAKAGVRNAVLQLLVDNGVFVWLDGQYRFGGRDPGNAGLGEYTINLGDLGPGLHYLQILREDHGQFTDYDILLTGEFVGAPPPPVPTLNPVAYYPFDGTASDLSGNGNHGTVQNATFVAGEFGDGAQFGGTLASYVEVPHNALLNPGSAVTLSLWVKENLPSPAYSALVYKAGALPTTCCSDRAYSLWTRADRGFHLTSTPADSSNQVTCNTPAGQYEPGRFVHVAGVVDAASQKMEVYVNGTLVQTCTYPGTSIRTGNYPLRIGAPFPTLSDQYGFGGVIDELQIYDRALSGAEIRGLATVSPSSSAVLDQVNDQVSGSLFVGGGTLTWQQGITAGINGSLSALDIYFSTAGTYRVAINPGAPWQNHDTTDDFFATTVSTMVGWNRVSVESAGFPVTAGSPFMVHIRWTDLANQPGLGGTGATYPGGGLFLNGSPATVLGGSGLYADMAFRMYVVPQ